MSGVERAISCFEEGFNCSQAVLSTYGPQIGLEREAALKVAGPFGGGMGRMGETCGAVTGAFMVIGLKHGRTRAEDVETRDKAYSLVRDFADRFKSRHGTIACSELVGCDVNTPEGLALAREKNLCPDFVRDAAEIVEQMLEWGHHHGRY